MEGVSYVIYRHLQHANVHVAIEKQERSKSSSDRQRESKHQCSRLENSTTSTRANEEEIKRTDEKKDSSTYGTPFSS